MNFDDLKPGPELDRLIAERVMEWIKTTNKPQDYGNWKSYPDEWFKTPDGTIINITNVPHYSTDIACAWQVVKRIMDKGFEFYLSSPERGLRIWTASFVKKVKKVLFDAPTEIQCCPAYYYSPEVAICIAALKAVKNEG